MFVCVQASTDVAVATIGAYLNIGSVTEKRTARMVRMSRLFASNVSARLVSSNAPMITAPLRRHCVMESMIVVIVLMRKIATSRAPSTNSNASRLVVVSWVHGSVTEITTAKMEVMRILRSVTRDSVIPRQSTRVRTAVVFKNPGIVTRTMIAAMVQMNRPTFAARVTVLLVGNAVRSGAITVAFRSGFSAMERTIVVTVSRARSLISR